MHTTPVPLQPCGPLRRGEGLTLLSHTGQLLQWAGGQLAAAGSRLALPAPHVGRLSISKGTLHAHMAGEPIPRVVRSVRASLRLGPGYDSMQLDLAGECGLRLLWGFMEMAPACTGPCTLGLRSRAGQGSLRERWLLGDLHDGAVDTVQVARAAFITAGG